MTVDSKKLVTTIAYLIGVKKHIVEQCFDAECHDTLQKLYAHKGATIIRYLCKLRTTLFQKFKKTDTEMRYNLMNLDRLEWYAPNRVGILFEVSGYAGLGFEPVRPRQHQAACKMGYQRH